MKTITVVSGLSRCGSSLVMQMLAAGGHPIYGPDIAKYPAYEHGNVLLLPDNHAWLAGAAGMAIKVLDPQRFRLPDGPSYRFVWCDRDTVQQARSQMKFLGAFFNVMDTREHRRAMAASLRRDRPIALRLLDRLSDGRVLIVRFEDLITDPLRQAESLCNFLRLAPESASAMAAHVRPRSPVCFDGLMEFDLVQ